MREDEEAYFQEPEFLDALARYEEAIRKGGPVYMDADDLTDIAEYYMMYGREKEANDAIQLAVSLHPTSVDPQVFLARQQMFHDNMKAAHAIADAIVDQEDREVAFLNTELLIREGKHVEAMRYLTDKADEQEEERAWFLYDCACIFCDYALWNEAQEWADRLKAEFPHHERLLPLLADIYTQKGDYTRAEPVLNELLDEDPYDTEAWNLLAETQGALEKYNEAIESTDYVLAIEPGNRRALMTRANCMFHQNRVAEAHDIYQQYLNEEPDDVSILYLDSVCLTYMNRLEQAAACLDAANRASGEMAPEQMHIYLQQTNVLSKLGRVPEAVKALKKAHKLAEKESYFEFELLMGQIYLENNQLLKAQKYFEKAVEKSEDRLNTLMLISMSLIDNKRYAEAAALLTGVEENLDGEVDIVSPYLAYCYYNLEENEAYLHYLKRAVANNRETTEFIFSSHFPGVLPEDYYHYAYRNIYGTFPVE